MVDTRTEITMKIEAVINLSLEVRQDHPCNDEDWIGIVRFGQAIS